MGRDSMTKIKDILRQLQQFAIDTVLANPEYAKNKRQDSIHGPNLEEAEAQLQKAFEEAVEEIIQKDVEQQWDDEDGFCQRCDFTRSDDSKECICILGNQLKATQRTKAKQVIKEMF